MKKVLSIVAAALLTLSLHAASWTFTSIKQSDFYPAGQEAVDANYWTAKGSSSYQYISTAGELYVTDGQKFAHTDGLRFLTRGEYFRVFFNNDGASSGIRLQNPNTTGTNPSIVIPACKAGSDLKIVAKQDGSGTMELTNAKDVSFTLDGSNTTYTTTVLAEGDVVINMSAGSGYIRSIEVVEHSVYTAQATKAVVTLFEGDDQPGVETTCTEHRGDKTYTIDGKTYSNVKAWNMKTNSNSLTFRVKNAKKVTFVGRAANDRGFSISLNGAAAENVMNTTGSEANIEQELTMADGVVNVITITRATNADVFPLAFIVEKDAEAIATMSGASMTFTNKDTIIYSGNIALSTVTNSSTESEQGFAKASNILLYDAGLNPIQALRVCAKSTVTIAVPSNYVIEKIGVRAAGAKAARTIKINDANGHNFAQVASTTESEYFEWTLSTPSSQLTLSTDGTMYFIITLFGYQTETFPVTLSNGYATFCAAEDVILPAELTAYVATGSTADEILLEEVAGGIVKANTGVVLMGEDGTYDLTITSGASALSSVLSGTVKRIANPGTVYCLYSDEGAFQQYTGAYIPANKAYFTAPAGAPARMAIRIGHVATGLENDNVNVNANKVLMNGQILIKRGEKMYNLQGQLVK